MELKYDKDIKILEDNIYWRNIRISEVNNVDFINESQKHEKIGILENRNGLTEQQIKEFKELQKPISVGLVL